MAERRSPLSKKEQEDIEKGVKTTDKGKVVPVSERVPSNRVYLKMTKAQFVAEMARLKEKKIRMAEFSKKYDEDKQKEIDALERGQSGVELAEQIEGLTKLQPAVEKSLRSEIAKITNEETQKKLSALLDEKKEELKGAPDAPKSYAVMKKGRQSAVKVFKGPNAEEEAQKYIVGLPKAKQKGLSVKEK